MIQQRLQYPLIKEYSLNHIRDPSIFKVYSLSKGYWSLWEAPLGTVEASSFGDLCKVLEEFSSELELPGPQTAKSSDLPRPPIILTAIL